MIKLTRNQPAAALLFLLSLWVVYLVPACRGNADAPSAAASPIGSTGLFGSFSPRNDTSLSHVERRLASARPFTTRDEAVLLSDGVMVWAKNKTPEQQRSANVLVARIRQRAYRTFHVDADAQEAAERYLAAASLPGKDGLACQWLFRASLLTSEATGASVHTPRAATILSRITKKSACQHGWEKLAEELGPSVGAAQRQPGTSKAAPGAFGDKLSTPVATIPTGPSQLVSVAHYPGKDGARVVLTLKAPVSYSVGELSPDARHSQHRLFVDLHETSMGKEVPRKVPSSGLLRGVRLGRRGAGTRVVLDLNGRVFRRVFYFPSPFRVVIDVLTPEAAARLNRAKTDGPRVVRRVVLDPGHGGSDPGATGPGGLQEKSVTLDIAHRAAPVLANELGIVTMLTRDTDAYVSLEERTARANAFHADLFISIHCNASPNPDATGVQTYVLDPSRDQSSRRIAARENAMKTGASGGVAQVVKDMLVVGSQQRSAHFAGLLQRSALASLRQSYPEATDDGVKTAAFFVLVGAQMPAVLFETSFISNPDEESRLATADYRQKLADAIVNAVKAYRRGL